MTTARITEKISMVICEGGKHTSLIEETVSSVRKSVVLDLIELAGEVREIDEIILLTNHCDLAESAMKLGVIINMDERNVEFHLGKRLSDLIENQNLQNIIYFGGGAAPLIGKEDLTRMALALKEAKNVVISNNFVSSDFIAFTPAAAINNIQLPAIDNTLAKLLHEQAGLRMELLESGLSTSYDIDTLIDVMILGVHPRTGARTRRTIRKLGFDFSKLEKAKQTLLNPDAEVLIYGRINPYPLSYITRNAKCWLRVIMEERGMRALGRLERQEVTSVFGYLLESSSLENLFSTISNLCDCAFLDTRVLFAHMKLDLTKWDRFNSDLGYFEKVENPLVRDLTALAANAEIPIICGGNTLVNGGIWALLDAANMEKLDLTSDEKIHRLVVELGSPIVGSTLDMIINYLGIRIKVVAISDAFSTRIDPPLKQEIKAGQVLYILGSQRNINVLMEYVSGISLKSSS
ncbi:MAG: hypothetical protein VB084_12965 [Syntrophomonadaceae bacterium]|nr:hypothetical protein [Syntrophomonadaceae bacterium]